MKIIQQEDWERMSDLAWDIRNQAYILGNTKVGAAALTDDQIIFTGCNIEHQFRCHDIHAEVNAISTMIANGKRRLAAILIVAERERFTPCGSCMDWIFQFGGSECFVAYQTVRNGKITVFQAQELMPYYPM